MCNVDVSCEALRKELGVCIDTKNSIARYSYEEIIEASKMVVNDYDWTIGFTLVHEGEIDRKNYSTELQKVPDFNLILEIWPNHIPLDHLHQPAPGTTRW